MQELHQPEPDARCPRCGGDLVEEDQTSLRRALCGVLAAVGIALLVAGPPRGLELRRAGAGAALVLVLILWRRALRWRCVSCRATYRRLLPRLEAQGDQSSGANSESSAPESSGDSL